MNRRDFLKLTALAGAVAALPAEALAALSPVSGEDCTWFAGWTAKDGQWHFVMVEHDAAKGTARCYLDNREVALEELGQAARGRWRQFFTGTKNAQATRERLYNKGGGAEWADLSPAEREAFGMTSFFDFAEVQVHKGPVRLITPEEQAFLFSGGKGREYSPI